MLRDISRRRLLPRLDVTVGFFIQSKRTLESLSQVGVGISVRERFSMQPLAIMSAVISPIPAMVSAMVSPSLEQRHVLVTETKDIVPLATMTNALMIVQEYGHVMLPFLKEPHVPALSQWMTKVERPYA